MRWRAVIQVVGLSGIGLLMLGCTQAEAPPALTLPSPYFATAPAPDGAVYRSFYRGAVEAYMASPVRWLDEENGFEVSLLGSHNCLTVPSTVEVLAPDHLRIETEVIALPGCVENSEYWTFVFDTPEGLDASEAVDVDIRFEGSSYRTEVLARRDSSGATATDPSPAPSQTPQVAASACQDAVTVSLDADIGSGRGGYFVLTNSGPEACALVGYIEPAAVDSAGATVTTVEHSDLNEVEGVPVELAPGASAYSWVFWDDSPDTLASCDQRVDAEALEVTVPGASSVQRIETGALPLCDGRGSILHLGPIDSERRYASKGI